MFDKRNRWIINTIMAIASLAFLGLLIFPIVGAIQAGTSNAAATPVATPASQQAELEQQAKGYELVLQREPNNEAALRGLLETRIRQNNIEGAIVPLEKLATLKPEETDYGILLAQAKQRLGDREGAVQAYRNILKTQPGEIGALQGIVTLMLDENRPEAAVGLLQDTLRTAESANKVKPGSVDINSVQLLLARVYAGQKRYSEAIALYDEIIKRDAQDFRPVFGKAVVLQEQGKVAEAKPLFTSAAELAPAQYKDAINQQASGSSPVPAAPAESGNITPAPSPAASPSAPAGATSP